MSIITKPLLRTSVVACVAAAGIVLITAPAQAAYTDCASGYACMWQATSYSGTPNSSFSQSVNLSASRNKINSIVNNGTKKMAYFYDNLDFSGAVVFLGNPVIGGQWRDPNLSNGTDATPIAFANRIESARFQ